MSPKPTPRITGNLSDGERIHQLEEDVDELKTWREDLRSHVDKLRMWQYLVMGGFAMFSMVVGYALIVWGILRK